MNTQQLMKRFSRIFALILMGMSLMYSQASLADSNEVIQKNTIELTLQATDYISKMSFNPYLGKEFNFAPLGYQKINQKPQVLVGKIYDDKKEYIIALWVEKDKVTFLYLADELIPTELFLSLCSSASGSLQDDHMEPSIIYIKNKGFIPGKNDKLEFIFSNSDYDKMIDFTFIDKSNQLEEVVVNAAKKQRRA